jgi:hypothetical protein
MVTLHHNLSNSLPDLVVLENHLHQMVNIHHSEKWKMVTRNHYTRGGV